MVNSPRLLTTGAMEGPHEVIHMPSPSRPPFLTCPARNGPAAARRACSAALKVRGQSMWAIVAPARKPLLQEVKDEDDCRKVAG